MVIFRGKRPNLRILTFPTPIKTSWETARTTVPVIWEARKEVYGEYKAPNSSDTIKIDAFIYLGMEDDDDAPFSFEKQAQKRKFEGANVDNREPTEDDLTGAGRWNNCPETISTEIDVETALKQVVSKIQVTPCIFRKGSTG